MSKTEINTYKASPITGEVKDLTINFCKKIPEFEGDYFKSSKDDYKKEAEIILAAMLKHVPGGLIDALFASMAAYKAGILIVPHEKD
jgi:hypothetical protein